MIVSKSKKENYCTEISNGNKYIFSDVTEDKGGKGQYLRPHDLICAGFASCLNITTRMILERKNIEYEEVIVKVDLDKSDENKTKFIYHVDIIGDISDEAKQIVFNMLKNCPVRKTLSKEIEFERI
ncbi:stress-induced protein OsmC [Clostridium pasteurianum DSM 525 = ATCC 6013]|uniref:OsmC family protein n=1 Tax=Clostridium pasteurianum DSM 525 = ATCC 6013 TaxID=1262449 RepID=A0A0H3J0U2_CLOPA|nr:OsmC family protein [Clostridium pasteurianum]AJA46964.1 stress-induced protein OsmC [Clostridium pasteurianum DSM 525 = ATCC 6013]AJA50952.1 stress-induced protein OsmC [Clostridium pasteurianum DSM 525 = ATCC 6013]AOZ74342.1 stress protein [Clostridium pasteurianum DSM 525 = ATCC 6013]AOZ78140.1 stress protein [Clostridium pasteurianum]ELP58214.1 Stress-induced protein OsmC [Clostridium pasteurianum DSM 525 = ATCC 6013]